MATRSSRPRRPARPRRSTSRTPVVVGVVVVVLVAAVVFGGVLLSGGSEESSGAIPVTPAPTAYPTTVEDGVVVAGGPAPHTLDLYEDPLCPACRSFEQRAGDAIAQAVAAGRLQVRYHLVNLLEQRSDPPGYSTAAGNAMICAAEHGAFPTVHTSLYAAQPAEGGAAYDTAQLVDLGQRAGAGPGYAECVQSGRYDAQIAQNYQQAVTNPALLQGGSFGTPTIVLDGRRLEPGSPALDAVLTG
ncbi:DsbA family protein [Actinomycetospora cinnamomea]|uniref:Protein-disulfide isomerase n=1 Tax=Actinomycetospora cinnamomea TaxID=663609 RepID=A0A2U1EVD0_9PSEU|nr:thioredoxin domain-containing protein [Actinomycetospora cinnamomea]PVZ03892.1 protein-disulfide isomerase [Actinomycetospora cinnamomea]